MIREKLKTLNVSIITINVIFIMHFEMIKIKLNN